MILHFHALIAARSSRDVTNGFGMEAMRTSPNSSASVLTPIAAGCSPPVANTDSIEHYAEQHNGRAGVPIDGYPIDPSKQKTWGCGFCVSCFASWKDLGIHIWSHFEAGTLKQDWSSSVYIHSLLHQASVYAYWQDLIRPHSIEGQEAIASYGWSHEDVQDLRELLEWNGPHRRTGQLLAKKAYDTLVWPQIPIAPPPPAIAIGFNQVDLNITRGEVERQDCFAIATNTIDTSPKFSTCTTSSSMGRLSSGAPQSSPLATETTSNHLIFPTMVGNPGFAGEPVFATTPASPSLPDQPLVDHAQTIGSLDDALLNLDLQFLLDYDFGREPWSEYLQSSRLAQ